MTTSHYRREPTRREALRKCATGFGAVALAALWAEQGRADIAPTADAKAANAKAANAKAADAAKPAEKRAGLHHAARAKNVIFLYMDGGVSQVDSFDPKEHLDRYNGQDPRKVIGKLEPTQFDAVGRVMRSPWAFKNSGSSGLPVSELFPKIGECADDLAVIRSMTSRFPEHTFANYFLHTGAGVQGRPSMGAWMGYGLGSDNRDLPGFVVLNGGLIPPGGLDNFNSGFLPAAYQGSVFRPADPPVSNIARLERTPEQQRAKLDLVAALDRAGQDGAGSLPAREAEIEAAIANAETAFRMQSAVPELTDIRGESAATRALYGLDAEYAPTRIYAAQCLLARRLVERGVRFVELTCPSIGGNDRWDQHSNLKRGHETNARAVDQPIAGLLRDLRSRGLLESTLVVWAGEFGRTPFAQGSDGRDHNPFGFSVWLAGGGVKGGVVHGATDDWGYKAIAGKCEIHDLHATMLHLLGVDHTRLTFRFGGRDMRLTDVHGHLIKPILA